MLRGLVGLEPSETGLNIIVSRVLLLIPLIALIALIPLPALAAGACVLMCEGASGVGSWLTRLYEVSVSAWSMYTVTLLALSRLNMFDLRSSPSSRLSFAGVVCAIFLCWRCL